MSEKSRPSLPIERRLSALDQDAEEVLLHAFHVAEKNLLSELIELVRDDELTEDRDLSAYRTMIVQYLEELRDQVLACSQGPECQRRPLLDKFEEGYGRLARRKVRIKRKRDRAIGEAREP